MPTLNLKKTHKPVKTYYKDLAQKDQLHLLHEGNVAPVFADLLGHCAKKVGYTLHEQHPSPLCVDGVWHSGILLGDAL